MSARLSRFLTIACALAAARPAIAQLEAHPATVVKAGGGFLIADGISIVPLDVVLTGDGEIKSAKIVAQDGSVTKTRVVGKNRVRFLYKVPPKAGDRIEELLDVTLRLASGDIANPIYTIILEKPGPPTVALEVKPPMFDIESPPIISVSASADGAKLDALRLFVDKGELIGETLAGTEGSLSTSSEIAPPELPPDAPSYLLLLSVASSATGFGFATAGVNVRAPVKISVEIPQGTNLVVEGAESPTEPVPAPADGKTVMDDVLVRYGGAVKVFASGADGKRQLSVVLPTGQVSAGLVAPIPGQTIADGGTGPTILVAVPPSPIGGKPLWPDLALEGAKLVKSIDLSDDVKALVIERPEEATRIQVLLDDAPAGEVELTSSRGVALALDPAPVEPNERAALLAVVKDSRGEPTDLPVPKVRFRGTTLTPRRIGTGRYRVSIPTGSAGDPGDIVEVVAELPPPPVIEGDALELVTATTEVALEGASPVVASPEATPDELLEVKPVEVPREPEPSPGVGFGIGVTGLVGATFGSLLVVGGGIQLELRLPFLEQRFGIRTGAEFVHHSGSGKVTLPGGTLDAKTRIAGFLIPLEIGFAVVATELFELLVRGGGALRIEQGVVTIEGDTPGGGRRVNFGGRAGIEASLKLSAGHICLGATLEGLGATANGFSSPEAQIQGSLMNIRADVSYRFWF
jgi:hypothetical protein